MKSTWLTSTTHRMLYLPFSSFDAMCAPCWKTKAASIVSGVPVFLIPMSAAYVHDLIPAETLRPAFCRRVFPSRPILPSVSPCCRCLVTRPLHSDFVSYWSLGVEPLPLWPRLPNARGGPKWLFHRWRCSSIVVPRQGPSVHSSLPVAVASRLQAPRWTIARNCRTRILAETFELATRCCHCG